MDAPLYRIDDEPEPFTLDQLVEANEDAPLPKVDLDALRALPVGASHTLGGGAAATAIIRRIS